MGKENVNHMLKAIRAKAIGGTLAALLVSIVSVAAYRTHSEPDTGVQKTPKKYQFNRDYEKNSDYCVKAVVAVRVNPMPSGTMDVHWPQYAKKAIEGKSIVVFGALAAK